jgi:hypothetical protein
VLEHISCPNSLGLNPISLIFGKNVAFNASNNWYFFQNFPKFQTTKIGLYKFYPCMKNPPIYPIAHFHVLGLFMAKKHDLSEKKIRMSRLGAVSVERKICTTPTA